MCIGIKRFSHLNIASESTVHATWTLEFSRKNKVSDTSLNINDTQERKNISWE